MSTKKSKYAAKIVEVTTTLPPFPVTNYTIEVKHGDKTWTVSRRYNDFKTFYKAISRFGFKVNYFPTMFVLKVDDSLLAKRKEAFNRLLEEVVEDQIVMDSAAWKILIGEGEPNPPASSSAVHPSSNNNNNTSLPPTQQYQQSHPPQQQQQYYAQPQPQYTQQQQYYAQPQPQAQPQQQVINLGNLLDLAKQMQQAVQQPGFIQPVVYTQQPQQNQNQPPQPYVPPTYDTHSSSYNPEPQQSYPPQQQPGIPYESAPAHPSTKKGGMSMHATSSSGQSNKLIPDVMDLSQLPPDFWNVYTTAKIPGGSLGPFQSFQNKYVPLFILLEETLHAEVSSRTPVKVFGLQGYSTQEHRRYSLYHHDGSAETWIELFHCKPLIGGLPTYVAIGNAPLPSQLGNRVAQLLQYHTELQKAQRDWVGE